MKRIKKTYPGYYYFEKDDILKLCETLKSNGLSKQSWKLPTNTHHEVGKKALTTASYFALNYNFPAVIGVFENTGSSEVVKILFVNNKGALKKFSDYTFPSSESEGPKYYIESEDEVRKHGLSDVVGLSLKKLNRNKGPQYIIAKMLNVLSYFYIFGYFIFLSRLSEVGSEALPLLTIFLGLAIVVIFLYIVSIRRGIYVNSFPHPALSFANQLIRGSFMDNPITFVVVRVVGLILLGLATDTVLDFLQGVF